MPYSLVDCVNLMFKQPKNAAKLEVLTTNALHAKRVCILSMEDAPNQIY